MLNVRTIPTLLLQGSGLVKGSKFSNHKYIGDPINTVRILNDKEVDEVLFLDIGARQTTGTPNFALLERIASQAFMPFSYGGALNSLSEIERVLRSGAEKVVLNTSFIENPGLVSEAAKAVGSQAVAVSIDVKTSRFGRQTAYTQSGTLNTKTDPVEVAKRAEAAGAGEIILCSIDREGTSKGYDIDLISRVCDSIEIPVIASGGAGSLKDFRMAVDVGASAAAAGDMFVFRGKHKAVLITYPTYDELRATYANSGAE